MQKHPLYIFVQMVTMYNRGILLKNTLDHELRKTAT